MVIFLEESKGFSIPVEVRSNFLWEGINSLHPLWLQEDHGNLSLISEIKEAVGEALLKRNSTIQENFGAWLFAFSSKAISQEQNFGWEETLKGWREIPPMDFFQPLLEKEIDLKGEKKEVEEKIRKIIGEGLENPHSLFRGLIKIVEEPEETKTEVLNFLEDYLPLFFPFYQRYKERIDNFCSQIKSLLERLSLKEFLKLVSPFLNLLEGGILEITHQGRRFDLKSAEKIIISPSFFFGHRYILPYGNQFIFCLLPELRKEESWEPDKELLKKVEALSNFTNILILKHLSQSYLCVKDLSEILKISQPLVTKHVNQLKACGYLEQIYKIRNRIYLAPNFLQIKKTLDLLYGFLTPQV